MRQIRVFAFAACLSSALGCGSRTGLRVADAHGDDVAADESADAFDAGRDVFDAFDATDATDATDTHDVIDDDSPVMDSCVVTTVALTQRSVEAMFVIDRSGSMNFDLEGRMGGVPVRWDVLRSGLAQSLPAYQSIVDMGAYFYPAQFDGSFTRPCRLATSIDVVPARNNVAAILDQFDHTSPYGATPTVDALERAGQFVLSRMTRSHRGAIVLATDGGPNCNAALNPATCQCTGTNETGMPTCNGMGYFCLDDMRAVDTVTRFASLGIPTYVIGIDDPMHPEYTDTLNRVAVAGGHPAVGATQFFSIRNVAGLVDAFNVIQQSIARCSFVLPAASRDPDLFAVQIAGVFETRDTTHTDGWDWTSGDFDEIALYGGACERAVRGTSQPGGVVRCGGH